MRDTSAYSAHEQLVRDARARPELWRLAVGLAVVVVLYVALNSILFAAIGNMLQPSQAETLLRGSSSLATLVLLLSFGFLTLGVGLAARQMQKRSLIGILGPRDLCLQQFWRVLRALVILGLVLMALPPYGMGEPLTQNLSFSKWLLLLPLSLFAVLIQTSAEEILFRGYLQQSLAARFRSPVIWIGVPSVLFAAGHYAPGVSGENALLVALWACIFGVLAADLTARAGTLGPAIAMHFLNNTVALVFISLPETLSGLALYLLPYDMSGTGMLRQWLLVDFVVMIVSWLTARLALRR
ncbi:CPBP family intramembrane glutamic endopeptidase [Ruegeria profundi]|uniref:CAAX protease n=1 Tax=Ruegeria profundi TaxID=1685378 RepID=A0A0X3TZ63_9RHOB|nr:type II CAAX endopeptidase family protein [Ruegeria profundi]KUJ81073.1 CAAX protease [Ruegeria profundi]